MDSQLLTTLTFDLEKLFSSSHHTSCTIPIAGRWQFHIRPSCISTGRRLKPLVRTWNVHGRSINSCNFSD